MGVPNFNFAVKSTSTRPPKTTVPQITMVSGVKGKFRVNEAGTKLIGLYPAEYLVFVSNENEVAKAVKEENEAIMQWAEENGKNPEDFPITWAVTKGWAEKDKDGNTLKTKKPLTSAEKDRLTEEGSVDEDGTVISPIIDRVRGSRLSTKSNEHKLGLILEGTDGTNAPQLRKEHDEDKHVVYNISTEYQEITVPNGNDTVDIKVYPLQLEGEADKIVRGK